MNEDGVPLEGDFAVSLTATEYPCTVYFLIATLLGSSYELTTLTKFLGESRKTPRFPKGWMVAGIRDVGTLSVVQKMFRT